MVSSPKTECGPRFCPHRPVQHHHSGREGYAEQLAARCPTPAWRSNRQEEARLKATSGGSAQYQNPRARKASHSKARRVVLVALIPGEPCSPHWRNTFRAMKNKLAGRSANRRMK